MTYSHYRSFKLLLGQAEIATEPLYQPQASTFKSKMVILALLRNSIPTNGVCHC